MSHTRAARRLTAVVALTSTVALGLPAAATAQPAATAAPTTVVTARAATKVTLTANTTRPKAGSKVSVTGKVLVKSGTGMVPASGASVALQALSGKRWVQVASARTTAQGVASFYSIWRKNTPTTKLRMVVKTDAKRAGSVSNVVTINRS